jgi:cell division protein FtsQ|tara:strand:+ start:3349 stop:4095 length:747 start_codon:yes stop_codon:yes gene_type:complete
MLQLIGKHINNGLLAITILVVVIFSSISIFIPSLLNSIVPIEKILIEGNNRSSENEVRKIIDQYKDVGLINFPLEKSQENIEDIDWIKRISIKRLLPDTLKISIVENTPYAVFIEGPKKYLIDDEGEIITLINSFDKYSDLLTVTGSGGNLNISTLIKEININYPEILAKLNEVEFIENRRWNLILKQNIKIKLPEKKSLDQLEKLKQLDQEQKIFSSNIIEIDLREIGRATIKLPGGEQLKTGLDEV